MQPSIEKRYRRFADLGDKRQCLYGGTWWTYVVIGVGDQTVVMLPGGAGEGAAWFDLALGLSERFACIVMDYPPVTSVGELVDGVAAVLDAEHVERAHLIGTSLGGMLAASFSDRAPHRVRSLVLGNTGTFSERDIPRLRSGLLMVRWAPWWLLRRGVHRRMAGLLRDSQDAAFWTALFDHAYRSPQQRRRLITQQLVLMDLAGRADRHGMPHRWHGPALIMVADDEPLIPPDATERMIDAHPAARIRAFSSGGHLLWITRPQLYLTAVSEFFTNVESAP